MLVTLKSAFSIDICDVFPWLNFCRYQTTTTIGHPIEVGVCPDVNDDGAIDEEDLITVENHLNQPVGSCPRCDVNEDGTINNLDTTSLIEEKIGEPTSNYPACESSVTREDQIRIQSVAPLPNPDIKNYCGIDIVFVLDDSGSINSRELRQMKDAFKLFVNAFLPNTPTQIAVVRFDDEATVLQDFTDDIDVLERKIDSLSSGGCTSWEEGLISAQNALDQDFRPERPNLVIFSSDGKPNTIAGGGPCSAGSDGRPGIALERAIARANEIKSVPYNTRIHAIGIGDGFYKRLEKISDIDSVTSSNFDRLAEDLVALADEFCGGIIRVEKYVDEDPNPKQGWEFTSSVTNDNGCTYAVGGDGICEVSKSGTTDPLQFKVEPEEGKTAEVEITENPNSTQEENHRLINIECFQSGELLDSDDGITYDLNSKSARGFEIPFDVFNPARDPIVCKFYNIKRVTGTIMVEKYYIDGNEDTYGPISDWNYTASSDDPNVTISPSSGVTTGISKNPLVFEVEHYVDIPVSVNITESELKEGFEFVTAECFLTDENGDMIGSPLGKLNNLTVENIPIITDEEILCKFYNKRKMNITLEKYVDGVLTADWEITGGITTGDCLTKNCLSAGKGRCWYLGEKGQSCDEVCADHGMSCVEENWNDDKDCTIGFQLTDCRSCSLNYAGVGSSAGPYLTTHNNVCWYRATGYSQNCSAGNPRSSMRRFCVCESDEECQQSVTGLTTDNPDDPLVFNVYPGQDGLATLNLTEYLKEGYELQRIECRYKGESTPFITSQVNDISLDLDFSDPDHRKGIICEFHNKRRTIINVEKYVDGVLQSNQGWYVSPDIINGEISLNSEQEMTAQFSVYPNIDSIAEVTLQERLKEGYEFDSVECEYANGDPITVDQTETINLEVDYTDTTRGHDEITCEFHNKRRTIINVEKYVDGVLQSNQGWYVSPDIINGEISLNSEQEMTAQFSVYPNIDSIAEVTLQERLKEGYEFDSVECEYANGDPITVDQTETINLEVDYTDTTRGHDEITCEFHNKRKMNITLEKYVDGVLTADWSIIGKTDQGNCLAISDEGCQESVTGLTTDDPDDPLNFNVYPGQDGLANVDLNEYLKKDHEFQRIECRYKGESRPFTTATINSISLDLVFSNPDHRKGIICEFHNTFRVAKLGCVDLVISYKDCIETCTDSDGPDNYYEKGIVREYSESYSGTLTDHCSLWFWDSSRGWWDSREVDSCPANTNGDLQSSKADSCQVIDYKCDFRGNNVGNYQYCPNGCEDGACI